MITRIEIDGFKSFENFALDLPPFLVLIGTNASGTSNLLDALTFVATVGTGGWTPRWRRCAATPAGCSAGAATARGSTGCVSLWNSLSRTPGLLRVGGGDRRPRRTAEGARLPAMVE
ncbi:hypothetical protein GCM10009530_29430 [Microbispora corallina]|uniref:Endonuclease GajA/Old nuclease/RecF-like AAA domain-containing protein n=1 Tax=Microbispora corallina TaxID=83302 RepID=A0ABQ4FZS0_9ACTN|nr:AAA family ATPase [Microbispora corallina]GIH40328.1 hypothetical protein Mco01_33280 [Microbispora corallina]